jgi:hypothetical protein
MDLFIYFLFKMKSGEKEKEGQLGSWIDYGRNDLG